MYKDPILGEATLGMVNSNISQHEVHIAMALSSSLPSKIFIIHCCDNTSTVDIEPDLPVSVSLYSWTSPRGFQTFPALRYYYMPPIHLYGLLIVSKIFQLQTFPKLQQAITHLFQVNSQLAGS
jgi:hypothetical protein